MPEHSNCEINRKVKIVIMGTTKQKDTKFYIIVAITLIIMYGFGFLPTFGQVTPAGMRILGIFLGCIFAWCFGEVVWSSIIGLVTLAIFGYGTMSANFASAFANNTVATMIVATVFCYAIEQCGLLTEISKWIVGQKWAQKSVWGLMLAFFIAATILGAMATNILPPVVLLWALFYEMAKEIGIKPYTPLATIILCGIGVTGYVGVATMPYSSMTVLVKGAAEGFDPNFVFNVGQYMLLNVITAIVFAPLLVFILRLIFGKMIKFEMPQRESYKMHLNLESKICLAFLGFIIASMVVPNFLTTDNPFRVIFTNRMTIVGTFMFASALLMIIRINGKPILDIVEGIQNVPWSLMLLIASALGISGYITADGMGIVPTIVSWLGPIVEGKSALVITLLFVAIGLIMTNFINDVVTCVVLYPIAAQFIVDAGGSTMLLAILFAQVTIQGCLMPSGSVIGAMFHGNVEWMKAKDIIMFVAIMELVLMIVLIAVSVFGNMIGI